MLKNLILFVGLTPEAGGGRKEGEVCDSAKIFLKNLPFCKRKN